MADRSGFTLVEMLAAIAILSFGLTSLVAVLSVGVDTRSSAELRDRAVRAVDAVVLAVQRDVLDRAAAADPAEPAFPVEIDPVPGEPRLRAVIERTLDEASPDVQLLTVRITWQEQGAAVGETFYRILPRGASFPARVGRLRRAP